MKNLTAKLKGLDYKQLALQHGEKAGFGLVVLIVLLALWSTQWTGIDKKPLELENAAQASAKNLTQSDWPEEKRKEFGPSDYLQRAMAMLQPRSGNEYLYATAMYHPLYPMKEPIREPDFRPVENLMAQTGRVIIKKRPPGFGNLAQADPLDVADPAEIQPANPQLPNNANPQFVRRDAMAGGAGRGGDIAPGGAPFAAAPAEVPGIAPDGMATDGGMNPAAGTAEGRRFVSVTGIVPLRKQIDAIARALNIENLADASALVEYTDFKIQRQKVVAGADPWAGPWEDVNIEVALELLTEVEEFDIDVVDPGVTDPVFTMPLPMLAYGVWADRASHPDLKNFQLSKEEQEQERLLSEAVLNEAAEMGEEFNEESSAKGFAALQYNMRDIRSRVLSKKRPEELIANTARQYGMQVAPGAPGGRMLGGNFQARMAAVGRLLLFRYIDFDVAPGEAYRYRVKLELKNPNFGANLAEVVDPSVAAGPTRETDWSEPTNPVVVAEDVQYYLANVDHRPGRNYGNAYLSIFQWDPQFGTYINNDALAATFGQFIGGLAKSWRLDVATPSLTEVDDAAFATRDILVDTQPAPYVVLSEHPDLNLKGRMSTARPEKIEVIPDEAAIVNRYGEFVTYDNVSQASAKTRMQYLVENERAPYADLKNKPQDGQSRLDQIYDEAFAAPEMMEEQPRRRGNPIRRRRGGGGAMGMP